MFGFLKKDYNRHSAYNVGVVFFRIAAAFLVLAAAACVYRFTYSPPQLASEGVHSYTVTDKDRHTYHHHRSTTVTYTVNCTDEEGGKHNQTVTDAEYSILEKGQTYQRPAYRSEGGGYFISWGYITDTAEATKEYYSRNPDQHIIARNIVMFVLLGLAAVNAVIGLTQLGREKRFIRDTQIMRTGSQTGGK